MYNFFKYQQTTRQVESQRRQSQLYSQWLLKNQDKKQQAKLKQAQKVYSWVNNELQHQQPQHIEDDHYRQWRFLKQFRDVENQPRFLGFKTFRHKPNLQMDKYYTQRERKEINLLSLRKQSLVDSQKIQECQRNRSLRSQGPLNPKVEFRSKKTDEDYLNPRIKFREVSDMERLDVSKAPVNAKFNSVYSSFEMNKSKIGVPKASYYDGELKDNRSKSTLARYEIDTEKSYKLKVSAPNSNPVNNSFAQKRNKIYFESKDNSEDYLTESKIIGNSRVMTAKMPEVEAKESKVKAYWKLAKTMELNGNKEIKDFLLHTQYDRKKDLSNLRMNMTCENYMKRPIL